MWYMPHDGCALNREAKSLEIENETSRQRFVAIPPEPLCRPPPLSLLAVRCETGNVLKQRVISFDCGSSTYTESTRQLQISSKTLVFPVKFRTSVDVQKLRPWSQRRICTKGEKRVSMTKKLRAKSESYGQSALSAVLTVGVLSHEHRRATRLGRALATKTLDLAIRVYSEVLEDGHLDRLALVLDLLGSSVAVVKHEN